MLGGKREQLDVDDGRCRVQMEKMEANEFKTRVWRLWICDATTVIQLWDVYMCMMIPKDFHHSGGRHVSIRAYLIYLDNCDAFQRNVVTNSRQLFFKAFQLLQTNQQVNTVTPSCETCGGPHSYNDCPATVGQNQNVYAVGAYNQGGNSYQPQDSNEQLGYFESKARKYASTVANPRGELKSITTRSGLALDGPTIPMPPPFINPEEDGCVEEILIDSEHGEYTIKVPPPQVQKAKPPS
ncbi:hypothetical protein Tco_0663236 [Tanacetum coccineum]